MNQSTKKTPVLLMVDDDREDIYLTKRAFIAYDSSIDFRSVQSGTELFDYLNCQGHFERNTSADKPDVILLDINIPSENGFTLLHKLKQEEQHSHVPVTMLTTSNSTNDINKAYKLGASSFICKSASADGMKNMAEKFCGYWFNFAELPNAQRR